MNARRDRSTATFSRIFGENRFYFEGREKRGKTIPLYIDKKNLRGEEKKSRSKSHRGDKRRFNEDRFREEKKKKREVEDRTVVEAALYEAMVSLTKEQRVNGFEQFKAGNFYLGKRATLFGPGIYDNDRIRTLIWKDVYTRCVYT